MVIYQCHTPATVPPSVPHAREMVEPPSHTRHYRMVPMETVTRRVESVLRDLGA